MEISVQYALRIYLIFYLNYSQGNILISDEGMPLLTDFGLSCHLGDVAELITVSNVAGALQWMAPELLSCGTVSVKSDVWAFGMTIVVGNFP